MSGPCPNPEMLSRSLDGDLPAAEARQLSRHVDACESCRKALSSLGRLRTATFEARPAPPESLPPRVLAALRKEGLIGRARSPYLTLASHQLWTLAAGLVLAVGMTLWLGGGESARKHFDEVTATAPEKAAASPAAPQEVPRAVGGAVAGDRVGSPPALEVVAATKTDRKAPASLPVARPIVDEEVAAGIEKALPPEAGKKQKESDSGFTRGPSIVAESGVAPKDSDDFRARGTSTSDQKLDDAPAEPAPLEKKREEGYAPAPAPPAASPQRAAANEAAPAPAKEPPSQTSPVSVGRRDAVAEGSLRQKSLAAVEAPAAPAAEAAVVPAKWAPEAGTVWDQPPRWTRAAERMIERVRGGRVVLRVAFAASGKITTIDVLSGDRNRGAELSRYLRALPQALHAAERGGVLVAGTGKVDLSSGS